MFMYKAIVKTSNGYEEVNIVATSAKKANVIARDRGELVKTINITDTLNIDFDAIRNALKAGGFDNNTVEYVVTVLDRESDEK